MPDSKPKISNLQKGVIECPNCSDIKPLSDYEGLNVNECSNCKTPFFVPVKLKHYWLYRPLGGGGMGSVYRALSEKDPGEFAIKILPRKQKANQELIDTLMLEGKVGKIIGKSPHIVEVVDYGEEDSEYFMVSRFVEGTRLDIFVSAASRLSERQALDIITQLTDAVIQIKNCGYLFRDMKPENIIISDETAKAKLFDFGLCMSIEQAANPDPNSSIEGSPYYLPPERIVAAPEGEYSEVYSLGMLLFYMLAGTTYFSQADVKDLVTKHVRSLRVASVQSRLKHCSPQMVKIIDKMIKRDPNQRYHTLSEVADLLKELLEGAEGYPLTSDKNKTNKNEQIKTKKTLNTKWILISMSVTACLAAFVFLGLNFLKNMEEEKIREAVILRTAEKLDISPDVTPPKLSEKEIQSLIESTADEIFKEEVAYIKGFNEEFERAKICKELKIGIHSMKKPEVSLDKVKKLAKEALNLQIESEIKLFGQEFPRDEYRRQIADSINIKLPLKTININHEQIKKQASESAEKIAEEILPVKLLDKVLANKKDNAEIKKATNEFYARRNGYKKSVYEKELNRIYKEHGYIKSEDKWVSTSDFIERKLKEKEREFERKQIAGEEKIILAAKKAFDMKEFYKKFGYRLVDNKWVSEIEMVDAILNEKKKQFNANRKKKLKGLKKEARISAELEVYQSNGYIFRNGKWQPAKTLLDTEVQKAMQQATGS